MSFGLRGAHQRGGGLLTVDDAELTLGIVNCTGATAGAINPAADVTTGWYLQPVLIPLSTTVGLIVGSDINAGVAT